MAETVNNKPTIQIRGLGLTNGQSLDKSPSPATKLLISHGKPNFTIARSPKAEDNGNPLSPQPNANNNYNAFKSAQMTTTTTNNNNNSVVFGTKFNGVFKPSNVSELATKEGGTENEAAKVVLRRPKQAEPLTPTEGEDANVPEFIRRQRRIQERLAKNGENVLDFENRRSGYFTHVMISPDSPNRTSFVETMASPAIVPALEMPAPLPEKIIEEEAEPVSNGHSEEEPISNGHSEPEQEQVVAAAVTNGHVDDVAPEDVAQAIEEVNKAVAGEDDDKTEAEVEVQAVAVTSAPLEAEPEAEAEVQAVAVTSAALETDPEAKVEVQAVAVTSAALETEPEGEAQPEAAVQAIAVTSAPIETTPAPIEANVEVVTPVSAEPVTPLENGQVNGHDDAITISHTNGHTDGPSIPSPDPSGALGVNYEPKTVVSFSQELGGGENNYPDTVKVTKDAPTTPADAELQEMTKLKFDIKADEQNEVQVTPVLRAE